MFDEVGKDYERYIDKNLERGNHDHLKILSQFPAYLFRTVSEFKFQPENRLSWDL
jgi:hypothetical protein